MPSKPVEARRSTPESVLLRRTAAAAPPPAWSGAAIPAAVQSHHRNHISLQASCRGMGPRRLVAASALALVLCAAGAAALYEKGSPVVQLTHRSFDKVLQSHVPTVVVRPGVPAACPPLVTACDSSRVGVLIAHGRSVSLIAGRRRAAAAAQSLPPPPTPDCSLPCCHRSSLRPGAATARTWPPLTRLRQRSCRCAAERQTTCGCSLLQVSRSARG